VTGRSTTTLLGLVAALGLGLAAGRMAADAAAPGDLRPSAPAAVAQMSPLRTASTTTQDTSCPLPRGDARGATARHEERSTSCEQPTREDEFAGTTSATTALTRAGAEGYARRVVGRHAAPDGPRCRAAGRRRFVCHARWRAEAGSTRARLTISETVAGDGHRWAFLGSLHED
jgi:hypothetical protein